MEPHQDNHPVTPEDKAKYSLPVEDVTQQFRDAGFPFSDRSASRWCQKARLDCILMPIDSGRIEKYFATPVSVEAEIAKMRRYRNAAMARHGAPWQDMAGHCAPTSQEQEEEKGVDKETIKKSIGESPPCREILIEGHTLEESYIYIEGAEDMRKMIKDKIFNPKNCK